MYHKILIVGFCGIGDIVMFLPTLRAIREGLPETEIHAIVPPNGISELLEMTGFVDEVEVIPWTRGYETRNNIRSLLAMLHAVPRLRRRHYDVSIWPFAFTTWKKELLSYLIGARIRLIHENYLSRGGLPASLNHLIAVTAGRHVVEHNLEFLNVLGIQRPSNHIPYLPIPESDAKRAQEFIELHSRGGKIVVGFQPGGNLIFNRSRCWGADNFAKLADYLIERYGAMVFLFGSPKEKLLLEKVVGSMANPDHAVLVWRRNLREVAALISRLDLFIANNSALMHIAGAVGVPVLGIFGPTDPTLTGPRGKNAWVVRLDLPCSPCFERVESRRALWCLNQKPLACLRDLSPDDVKAVVDRILNSAGPAAWIENGASDGGIHYPTVVSIPSHVVQLLPDWSPVANDERA